MKEQQILNACNHYEQLDRCLKNSGQKKILLVCGSSIRYFHIGRYFDTLESAMDVAKCIKLYADMDHSRSYLQQTIVPNDIRLIAVPTTAGTGSEATRYAVIYENGEKQSVSDDSCIPDAVVVDPSVLKSLPLYQKKATMMDALCHSIEACWSIHSSEESRQYSRTAIEQIVACKDAYLKNTEQGNAGQYGGKGHQPCTDDSRPCHVLQAHRPLPHCARPCGRPVCLQAFSLHDKKPRSMCRPRRGSLAERALCGDRRGPGL